MSATIAATANDMLGVATRLWCSPYTTVRVGAVTCMFGWGWPGELHDTPRDLVSFWGARYSAATFDDWTEHVARNVAEAFTPDAVPIYR